MSLRLHAVHASLKEEVMFLVRKLWMMERVRSISPSIAAQGLYLLVWGHMQLLDPFILDTSLITSREGSPGLATEKLQILGQRIIFSSVGWHRTLSNCFCSTDTLHAPHVCREPQKTLADAVIWVNHLIPCAYSRQTVLIRSRKHKKRGIHSDDLLFRLHDMISHFPFLFSRVRGTYRYQLMPKPRKPPFRQSGETYTPIVRWLGCLEACKGCKGTWEKNGT